MISRTAKAARELLKKNETIYDIGMPAQEVKT